VNELPGFATVGAQAVAQGGEGMKKMTAVIELRVPEALRDRIDKEAERLALRPVDITRHALALGLRMMLDNGTAETPVQE